MKSKLLKTSVATVLLLAGGVLSGGTTLAAEVTTMNTDVDVEIEAGLLEFAEPKLNAISFGKHKKDGSVQTVPGTASEIKVNDFRGSATPNWQVTVKDTTDVYQTNGLEILLDTSVDNGGVGTATLSVTDEEQVIFSNTTGALTTTAALTPTLSIPANIKAGVYQTVLEWKLGPTE